MIIRLTDPTSYEEVCTFEQHGGTLLESTEAAQAIARSGRYNVELETPGGIVLWSNYYAAEPVSVQMGR